MKTVTVDGAHLAYDEDGDQNAPAVVMLHAGIADRRMGASVAATVGAQRYRVIRYDLRGYGESTLPQRAFAHRDDLVGVLDALGIERAAIVGCSFGGAVAVDAALAHPERVSGLVLVGAAVSGNSWSTEFRETWHAVVGEVDDDDLDAVARAEVRFWVVGPDRRPEDVDADLLAYAYEADLRALAAEAALEEIDVRALDPPAYGRLGEIRVPTWTLCGAADVADVLRLADRIAAEVPAGRRLPDVPDAAHLLPLERPEPVATTILDFLRR